MATCVIYKIPDVTKASVYIAKLSPSKRITRQSIAALGGCVS